MRSSPSELLLDALAWGCFLAICSFLAVVALRRRQHLRDRPWLAVAFFSTCLLVALSVWWPFPDEGIASIYFYFVFAGPFHLVSFLLLALLMSPIAFVRSPGRYLSLVERIGLFSALLLATGALLNAVWMMLVYRRLYVSQDTVVDWFSFIPFGQWVLDVKWGDETGSLLAGAELWHLQALWLLFAVVAWGTAALAYRRIVRSPGASTMGSGSSPAGMADLPMGSDSSPTGMADLPRGGGSSPTGMADLPMGSGFSPIGMGSLTMGSELTTMVRGAFPLVMVPRLCRESGNHAS